jgi:galactokinase
VSSADADAVTQDFADRHGHPPTGVWVAPGRVNLIGEHTDYNDGFVMPFALAQAVTVAAAPRDDDRWSVTSLSNGETSEFGRADLQPGMSGWQAYVAGVIWALVEAGHQVSGADLVLTSDVPIGAGLSSSAALECAVLAALADLDGLQIEPLERAKLARRCENEFVGAPTGLMDQAASTLCTADHALFFDCRTFQATQVSLELGGAGLELLVLDTNTPHTHVDGEYADRRRACEEAAALLGVPALRDVTDLDAALAALPEEVAAEVLQNGQVAELAPLLDASHTSMRDDFEITAPTVDLAVETARAAGALGARMTGGGFGGCIIALVPAGRADAVAAAVADAFDAAGYAAPQHFVGVPSQGAHRAS